VSIEFAARMRDVEPYPKAATYAHGGDYLPVQVVVGLLFALATLAVIRVGLLAFIVFNLTEEVLVYMPVTTELGAWYSGISTQSLLLEYVTLALFAGVALALYIPLVAAQGRSLERHEQEILEVVGKDADV